MDAVIISDLHLGSDTCQAKQLVSFLNSIKTGEIPTKCLILNGDVFDSWDFRRLKKNHWKVLSEIRKLSDEVHIVWINGNHDGPAEIISHLLGVDFLEEYILLSGNRKIAIFHGDCYDQFISDHPILTMLADWIYGLLQRIDPSFGLARQAKKASKTFLRNSEIVQLEAMAYARRYGYDVVCCGHTHLELEVLEDVQYFNSGCWTETPCCFLSVDNGIVNLNHYISKEESLQPVLVSDPQ